MLKWTNPAQKASTLNCESVYPQRKQTPYINKRQRRRTTICQINKENLPPPISATPERLSNFGATPKSASKTPEVKSIKNSTPQSDRITRRTHYNHTTSKYASTLPRYEEEYSPSTFLPVGQELALRGLFPDVFTGNQRYFSSPQVNRQLNQCQTQKNVGPKRKLEDALLTKETPKAVKPSPSMTGVSTKMSDRTLDKLIDAILESACKTQKKKKPLKALNLRRRTLLKSQQDNMKDVSLSPSYAAGDDPASDLSFLLAEPSTAKRIPASPKPLNLPPTPLPHTPGLRRSITKEALLSMPTPVTSPARLPPVMSNNESTTTFNLETPVRQTRKRRSHAGGNDCHGVDAKAPKRYKQDNNGYLEVGLALPSIYV